MTVKNLLAAAALAASLGVSAACSLFSPETSFAPTHPEALPAGRPLCTECHEGNQLKGALKPYASFDHTVTFVKDHRFAAGRDALEFLAAEQHPVGGTEPASEHLDRRADASATRIETDRGRYAQARVPGLKQRVSIDRIDNTAPAFPLQRLARRREFGALDAAALPACRRPLADLLWHGHAREWTITGLGAGVRTHAGH